MQAVGNLSFKMLSVHLPNEFIRNANFELLKGVQDMDSKFDDQTKFEAELFVLTKLSRKE